jgi:acid phosphatase class B
MSISDEDLAQARNIDVEQVRLLRQSRGTTN